jgi:hypothetical protein
MTLLLTLNTNTGSRITIPSLLGVVFIALKLCGVIHWSWIWVLAPFWMVFAVLILLVSFVAIYNSAREP